MREVVLLTISALEAKVMQSMPITLREEPDDGDGDDEDDRSGSEASYSDIVIRFVYARICIYGSLLR